MRFWRPARDAHLIYDTSLSVKLLLLERLQELICCEDYCAIGFGEKRAQVMELSHCI